jgi:transposase
MTGPDLEQLAKSSGRHSHGICGQTGMRAYSTDLKERLVRAVANGLPMREAARRFEVAVTTVKRWAVVQQRATGSLARKPIPGRPRAISEQEALLQARLAAAPGATVLEQCAWWAEHQGHPLSETTMWRAVRRLGWTHKKRHWQPASATRRGVVPGGRRSPSSTRSSSSLSTKAAPINP